MFTKMKMQDTIALVLLIGTLLSTALVLSGGIWYLIQNGNQNLQFELLKSEAYQFGIKQIWDSAIALEPLGIVILGILTLVLTQILRIALLTVFYASTHDYWFTGISFFILLILLYSLLWRD